MNTFLGKLMMGTTCAAMAMMSGGAMAANDLRIEAPSSYILAAAADPMTEGAKNFISSMGDRGINFLGDVSMTEEAKKAEFRTLLNDSFDMATIGRFSLGQYWKVATPAQQKEYQKLFNDMIVKVYSKRFSDYKGQKFDVRTASKVGDKDVLVNSFIVPTEGPEVKVDWRVRSKGGSYKVVDILVEGVSMSQTQRADFSSVIQRGGGNVESLLTYLRK